MSDPVGLEVERRAALRIRRNLVEEDGSLPRSSLVTAMGLFGVDPTRLPDLEACLAELGVRILDDKRRPGRADRAAVARGHDLPLASDPDVRIFDVAEAERLVAGLARSSRLLTFEDELLLGRAVQRGAEAERILGGLPGRSSDRNRRNLAAAAALGRRAVESLEVHNLKLVLWVLQRVDRQGMPEDDLIQEGWFGLHRAAQKYDPTKGFKFSTYATWWIRQAMERAVANQSRIIRLPVHMVDRMKRVAIARDRLLLASGRARAEDVAAAVRMDVATVRQLLLLGARVSSTDEPMGDGLTTIGEMLVGDAGSALGDEVDRAIARRAIDDALCELEPRERTIIELRYGLTGEEPMTLDEIGSRVGLTRERVRQLQNSSLEHLRCGAADRFGDLLDGSAA